MAGGLRRDPTAAALTIGQVMGLIAAFAVLWALAVTPTRAGSSSAVLLPLALLIVGPIAGHPPHPRRLGRGALPVLRRGRSMERRAVSSFGAGSTGATPAGSAAARGVRDLGGRLRARSTTTSSGRRPRTTLVGPAGLEDEDLIYSKTHVNLIRNKRLRRPDNPNGPGLE